MPIKNSKETFVEKAKSKHGDKYDYSKVEYINNKTPVIIVCKRHGEFKQRPDSHLHGKGCYYCGLDTHKEKLYGVGINDLYETQGTVMYRTWKDMLERCYTNRNPGYKDCTVCEEWKTISNFKKWFDANYKKGFHLDKDIKITGNREYSPEACMYIPPEINMLFTRTRQDKTDLPRGLYYLKRLNKYCVQVSVKGKTTKHVGLYDTIEEASAAYKVYKSTHVKEIADKYYNNGDISEEVYNSIINHKF